MTSWVDAVLII